MVAKPKRLLCLGLILSGGLFGCSTKNQGHNWPVFYDSEKGPNRLSISHEAHTLDFYTNGIAAWNCDLFVPPPKISSPVVKKLGDVDGLQVIEVRLVLTDTYYTDVVMILEEVGSGRFLPVYVQDYNRHVRSPSANSITKEGKQLTIKAGMDYSGTGHFQNHYKMAITPDCNPLVFIE